MRAPGAEPGTIKRLVTRPVEGWATYGLTGSGEMVPVMVVEQLNPPRRYTIDCATVLAVHKCIGKAESGRGTGKAAFRWKDARP